MAVYLAALSVAQFGPTVLALRLPLAIASVSSVLAVFWLGRVLFEQDIEGRRYSPWRGVMVGAVGAGLMAVSIGQTFMGRMAFRANLLPLFLTVSLALLWLGWRQRRWWVIALAGIGTGLIPYTYIPARFVPFLLLLFGFSFLLPHGSVSRSKIRTELPFIGLFLGTATVVAAPLLIHFALNPDHFFMRSSQLWIFDDNIGAAKTLSALIENVWEYLLIFGIHSDQYWHHFSVKQMVLYPLEALFFWLGVGLALRRWRDPTYRLLLLWLGVMLLPGILSVETGSQIPRFPLLHTPERRRPGDLPFGFCWSLGNFPIPKGQTSPKYHTDTCSLSEPSSLRFFPGSGSQYISNLFSELGK